MNRRADIKLAPARAGDSRQRDTVIRYGDSSGAASADLGLWGFESPHQITESAWQYDGDPAQLHVYDALGEPVTHSAITISARSHSSIAETNTQLMHTTAAPGAAAAGLDSSQDADAGCLDDGI
eukprot:355524-Chlamydomonas_euryale.AAC.1